MAEEITNYLEDDWDDNALSGRSNSEKGIYYQYGDGGAGDLLKAVYRPLWTVTGGNPSVQSGSVVFGGTDADAIETPADMQTGEWEYDFTWTDNQDWDTFSFKIFQDGSNHFRFELKSDNADPDFKLVKIESGSSSHIIDSSWEDDQGIQHTVRYTRDSYGEFELFYDGASQGTGTDTFTLTNMVYKFDWGGQGGGTVEFDNFTAK